MTPAASLPRAELWLPFLRYLTDQYPGWGVWKNVESALHGHGDVDSLAPPWDWPAIQRDFGAWVRERELGPWIVCRHVPQGPHLVAVPPGDAYLLQLDVKTRATFRGSTLVRANDLRDLAVVDPQGIRRLRPGAEGVVKLLSNGMRPGGMADPVGLRRKGVVGLLASDPEGARALAERLGPMTGPLRAGIEALLSGGWDGAAMRRVERMALLRALAEPGTAASRLWFQHVLKGRCAVLDRIRNHDRSIPHGRERWLDAVSRNHRVVPASGPS